jgi:uncharacterized protein (TIGR00251 family)
MPPFSLDKLVTLGTDGIFLTVKVSPKSHKDAVKGIVDLPHGRIGLAVRVCPPAADGAANEAVIGLLANLFEVPRGCLKIKSGATGRTKVISIKGGPLMLQTRLSKVIEPLGR